MKALIKSVFILVFFIILSTSCNKEILEFHDGSSTSDEVSMSSSPVLLCPNPYDSIGIQHNYYLENINWEAATSLTQIAEIFNNFSNTAPITPEFLERCGILCDSNKIVINDTRLDSCYFSSVGRSYFINLVDTILNKGDLWDLQSFSSFIKNHECLVQGSSLLSTGDKEKLLIFLAISKYSANYWYNYDPSGLESRAPWKWWRTVLSDAFGGIVGAVMGGPIGAGIGAAVASGADGLAQHYGWDFRMEFYKDY